LLASYLRLHGESFHWKRGDFLNRSYTGSLCCTDEHKIRFVKSLLHLLWLNSILILFSNYVLRERADTLISEDGLLSTVTN